MTTRNSKEIWAIESSKLYYWFSQGFRGTMGIMSYYRVGGNFPIGSPDTKMSKETSGLLACVNSSLGVF